MLIFCLIVFLFFYNPHERFMRSPLSFKVWLRNVFFIWRRQHCTAFEHKLIIIMPYLRKFKTLIFVISSEEKPQPRSTEHRHGTNLIRQCNIIIVVLSAIHRLIIQQVFRGGHNYWG